ncbi:formate dehydrogenase accessory sulfurtransferase FdhD [Methylovirgula sp. 4M-Z18]|nr:formate dehydrogenase accessory sulfurtransferase FdhD [Methylovirgula sp. 4M-Z18]
MPTNARAFTYAGASQPITRTIPVETPVNILYGNQPFAVMMASPQDIEDFCVGFSLTEGIIDRLDDIRAIEIETKDKAVLARMSIAADKMQRLLARSRNMMGRTGCGLCGIEDLAQLKRDQAARVALDPAAPVSAAAISRALQQLEAMQPLNALTHAVHAAAFADVAGDLVLVREDVGRHNALDKLVGALLRKERSAAAGFVVISSRASFEMVEKAAAVGAHTLVAISAPTSLAIERARDLALTMIAVARHDGAIAFTGELNILTGGLAA